MRCAVVLADGIKQVMLTPESANEKMALEMIGVDDDITVERKQGTFYEQHRAQGYNVALCQGGYLRAYDDSESLMLVIRSKKNGTESGTAESES